jgi:threonine-phosphate decarboxylase
MAVDFPKKVVHGGTGKWQREKTKKNVLDFSASTNPFPPRFEWHCNQSSLESYPDDQYHELKERIAAVYHRRPEEICVGNGSIEIIRVFCSVVLNGRKHFYTQTPTFGEYELSARLAGAKQVPDPFKADVTFVCNPNNPTGVLQKKISLKKQLAEIASIDRMLFCDEAFIALSNPAQSMAGVKDTHLFVLQSLTKSFSVPGIRFGFGFGDPGLIERIETARSPWSVNAFAEAYAMEALLHMDELEESRHAIGIERDWLVSQVNGLGLSCHQSSANYLLIECGRNVTEFCNKLVIHDILVRNCSSFGLPTCIRVAVRTHDENLMLVEALTACMR